MLIFLMFALFSMGVSRKSHEISGMFLFTAFPFIQPFLDLLATRNRPEHSPNFLAGRFFREVFRHSFSACAQKVPFWINTIVCFMGEQLGQPGDSSATHQCFALWIGILGLKLSQSPGCCEKWLIYAIFCWTWNTILFFFCFMCVFYGMKKKLPWPDQRLPGVFLCDAGRGAKYRQS